ncbi:MAG: GNAT family N-acetyltransferase [Leptolyngbya sp. SIO1D8]|nr:GNAT family N-acetyltransferase [Leptolyngbya sp. SIO1D8]
MSWIICPIEKEHALTVLCWCYPSPYDCYNFDPRTFQSDLSYLLDAGNAFFVILHPLGGLEGYCSFGRDGQVPGGNYSDEALDIGMGIRPDLIGQGRGVLYAQAVANYGVNRYRTQQLRVTIAAFNKRAQRVWEKLGFEPVERFIKIASDQEFVILVRRKL